VAGSGAIGPGPSALSTNFVCWVFCELRQETVRKGFGGACNVALRATETVFPTHFALRIPAKFAVEALLTPLFGQFQKENSRKSISTILHKRASKCPDGGTFSPFLPPSTSHLATRLDGYSPPCILCPMCTHILHGDAHPTPSRPDLCGAPCSCYSSSSY
jgi:hypothetical protein